MSYYILLCDTDWKIKKVLEQGSTAPIETGSCLTDFFKEPEKLEKAVSEGMENWKAVSMKAAAWDVTMTVVLYELQKYFLVLLGHVESQEDFQKFSESCVSALSWAEKDLRAPYDDGYLQIQQMNNQLINSQRALMKANRQLKQVLEEMRKANTTIALLERDGLTNLYTGSTFCHKVETRMKETSGLYDVILLDVDHFRLVNELFGREEGDKLIKSLALFLLGLDVGEKGIFARAYADTFYICMPGEIHFPEILDREVTAYLKKYPLPIRLRERIGVCSAEGAGISAARLCDQARLAMSTLRPENQTHIASYDKSFHEEIALEQKILDGVQGALKNGEFLLYLQPKVKLPDGELMGAEALIRWKHPEFGWIRPDIFIPILERNRLVYEVDQFIWEEACKVLQKRRQQGEKQLPISINVARGDLYQKNLPEVLKNLLKKYGLNHEELHLEIIERDYAEDSETMCQVLTGLKKEGFLIEMDDFGIGESSLAMAARMPVDYLKLDRQFIIGDLNDKRHTEIIRFIINMAKALDLGVIAEGIETREQAQTLYEMGCAYAQGFYFGRPDEPEKWGFV